jgi:amidase
MTPDTSLMSRRTFLAGGLSAAATAPLLAGAEQSAAPSKTRGSDDLHYLGLTEIAARIRRRELSPVDVTKAQLARIEKLDPQLNSYAAVLTDLALAQARKAETEIQSGRYRGPLHGVPVAVKDLCFTKGVATKGGTRVLAAFIPDHDATVVARLAEAGAVLLGKLNLTEGAMAGYHRDFKVPRNPWGANRFPGFSSSGSGVATAAGLCYASLGSDTGGSIRYPSAANGIVGLKPTWGRVSRYGVLALAASLDHIGPMTRRVADAAVVLGAIAGNDSNDPTTLSDPVPDYLRDIEKSMKGVRIGFDEAYATGGVPGYVADAVRRAVRDLEKLGALIVPAKMPDMNDAMNSWGILCSAEAAVAHEATFPSRANDYGDFFRQFLQGGRAVTGAAYAKASMLRAELRGTVRRAFQGFDVLVCPTTAAEAVVYEPEKAYGSADATTTAGVPVAFLRDGFRFIIPYDLTGYPTLSLPSGQSPDGLPLSLQLVGHPLSEALLCRVGHAYENATEWHRRHPALHD